MRLVIATPTYWLRVIFPTVAVCLFTAQSLLAQDLHSEGDPEVSVGAEARIATPNAQVRANSDHAPAVRSQDVALPTSGTPKEKRKKGVVVDKRFEGFGFNDNAVENSGVIFIPPDPIGAAGKNRLIAVVNSMIEARTRGGELKWRDGLFDFFAPLAPINLPFDPKIVYDEHEDRFVVVALELIPSGNAVSPDNISRILLAVSRDGTPQNASDWYFQAINSKELFDGFVELWADYPGFEVDEEAVYITANMFAFPPFSGFGGVRLWIVDKGASGGFYDGGPAAVTKYDPYAAAGIATTTMPAQVHGAAGPGIGTYLVSYSGLSDGVDEYVQVVRIDDPLGTPAFIHEFVNIGNIESFSPPELPDAPQAGSASLIEVNDRRVLDAVWRDDRLWLTTTVNPDAGPDAGQTTAYWVKLNTSAVTAAGDPPGLIALDDQGGIGGEDIAPGAFTFFPAVAVNRANEAMFGFSASAPSIFVGAFAAGRQPGDPAGTVQASETVHAGEGPYTRTFGSGRNRWGDYSGISVDPTNDRFFWVFNEFADTPGTPTFSPSGPEDGRWGTAWARVKYTGGKGNDALLALGGDAVDSTRASDLPAPAESFALDQNYPNPFNPSTSIAFTLPEESEVQVAVFDMLGHRVQQLADGVLPGGRHVVTFEASGLASGLYFVRLVTPKGIFVRRMQLVK